MILRAAIVFLLVINLGVGAWWMGGGNGTRRPAASATPAGVPGLRLVDEAARRRESELTSKGIPAQAEPLGDTAAQAWLEARLPAAADRAALAAIAPAKAVDCAPRR